jgi:hypothetical protein
LVRSFLRIIGFALGLLSFGLYGPEIGQGADGTDQFEESDGWTLGSFLGHRLNGDEGVRGGRLSRRESFVFGNVNLEAGDAEGASIVSEGFGCQQSPSMLRPQRVTWMPSAGLLEVLRWY